jgi:hypothetical protein
MIANCDFNFREFRKFWFTAESPYMKNAITNSFSACVDFCAQIHKLAELLVEGNLQGWNCRQFGLYQNPCYFPQQYTP